MSDKKSYEQSGVNTNAADAWVERLASITGEGESALKSRLRDGIGSYAAVFELTPDRWIASSCDGVGTKLLWTLAGLGTPEDLAQDLVGMNVNDLICVGAKPLIFLDYIAFSDGAFLDKGGPLDLFIKGLHTSCLKAESLLVGGETAQMPDFYQPGHFDISGFAVGELAPSESLSVEKLRPGAKVWGWTSSGPHSNGFSWLRKLFDSETDAPFIRKHLMAPTALYVSDFRRLREVLKEHSRSEALQAAYHITGSGLLNLLRAQPKGREIGVVFDQPWDVPEWVRIVKERSAAGDAELYSTFNMGMGMMVMIEAETSKALEKDLRGLGLKCLGTVDDKPRVRIKDVELT
ncbi:MAG: AIR synthase related protein [Bdellovibrionota bacterium]